MIRDDLDHPTTQAYRVREATRGIYHHTKEQLLRVVDLVSNLPGNDPFHTEWARLQSILDSASANLRAANDLAHIIGSRSSALRDQGRADSTAG